MCLSSKKYFGTGFFIATLSIISSPLGFAIDGVSADGLMLTVPAFTIGAVHYEGGTIQALPLKEQFLELNLKTRKLHLLPRAIGDGEIVLARVSATESAVTKIEARSPMLPTTRIPRAQEKIAKGQPIVVSCFGSSLVAGGTSPNGWQKLLFDPTHPEKRFYVGLSGKDNTSITNKSYGVGGTNARYTISLMGEATRGEESFKTSAYDCDLAIVALLPNGGEDRDAAFEGVVRMLRSSGVEVLLLTDNSNAGKGVSTGLWGSGLFVRKLADRYGCALADTASYMLEGELMGEKVFADAIHQSQVGHKKWAEAIAGVLLPGTVLTAAPVAYSGTPTLQEAFKVPGEIAVVFTPEHTGGKEVPGQSSDSLSTIYRVPAPKRLSLSVGDSLVVSYPGMMAADIVYTASSTFEIEIREINGTEVLKTITYKAPAKIGARPHARSVFSASELKTVTDRKYRATVTGGEVQIYAVIYHLPEKR